MRFRHGARHAPESPLLSAAVEFNSVRVGGVTKPVNWFDAYAWQTKPDGDILLNNRLGVCCEVADLRLCQFWLAGQGIHWPIPDELVLLRYRAVAGYQDSPATDGGTLTQTDMWAWSAAPIVASGQAFNVRWLTVPPDDAFAALKRGPLLLTLGLTPDDEDDPHLWSNPIVGKPSDFHRVVAGAERSGLFDVHSYGQRYLIHPSRVIAADLLLHVDAPVALRTAGIAWDALT